MLSPILSGETGSNSSLNAEMTFLKILNFFLATTMLEQGRIKRMGVREGVVRWYIQFVFERVVKETR